MNISPSIANKIQKYAVLYAGIILFVLIAMLVAKHLFDSDKITAKQEQIVCVSKQNFRLTITERGIVRPARITPIKSQISGNQAKLIWVLPEGQRVNQGLLVARFDTKPLTDIMQKTEQQLADARAQLEDSLKALELLKESGKSAREDVQRKLEIAEIKANDLRNGSGPLKRQQLKQIVTQANRNKTLFTLELEDLQPLLENGHVTMREYERAENETIAARETLEIAKAELSNFDKYEWPRIVREAEVIMDAAQMDLARVQRTAELEQQQQLSKVERYRRTLKMKQEEFKKAQKEVAACDIYAPTDGILLYSELPQQGKKRSIQIGDSIWQGQTFLEVPDTNNLVIETNIREIDVAKLSRGMPVEIILDAYPSQVFNGTLATVNALAHEDDNNTGIRRFSATIKTLDLTSAIYVGMSASITIIHKKVEDVLAVPTGAIIYRDGKTLVKELTSTGNILTEVSLGDSGIKWMEIVSGLNENDRIINEAL